MSLQVEKLDHNMAVLTIEVPAEELEKAIETVYQRSRRKISLPGFRKGKAPRRLIEQAYGKDVFYQDAAEELYPMAYEEALKETEEQVVSFPQVNVVQLEEGKPFIFTAKVALKPEVVLGTYKGVKVDKMDTTVTEEDIDAEINRERDKNARLLEVEDRAVQEGDVATLDFEGFVDGEAFEGGKGTDYPLTIGSHAFIPGFEEALVGAVVGQETEVNVTFPEDYQAEDLAGKAAVFKCTVKKLQERLLPELDDDFASEVSEESDTVEEYKEEIRKKLSERKNREAKSALEDAVMEAVVEEAQMDIPDPMIDAQVSQMTYDYALRLRYQGISLEQYLQMTGMTRETLANMLRPQALTRIQSRLVLEAVAAAEGMEATQEEIDKEIESRAQARNRDAKEMKESYGERELKELAQDICVRKAMDFLTEHAQEKEAEENGQETEAEENA